MKFQLILFIIAFSVGCGEKSPKNKEKKYQNEREVMGHENLNQCQMLQLASSPLFLVLKELSQPTIVTIKEAKPKTKNNYTCILPTKIVVGKEEQKIPWKEIFCSTNSCQA